MQRHAQDSTRFRRTGPLRGEPESAPMNAPSSRRTSCHQAAIRWMSMAQRRTRSHAARADAGARRGGKDDAFPTVRGRRRARLVPDIASQGRARRSLRAQARPGRGDRLAAAPHRRRDDLAGAALGRRDRPLRRGLAQRGAAEASRQQLRHPRRGRHRRQLRRATVSLRRLGPGSTLVLVDGRRVAPLGFTGDATFVDINQIPVDVIERVEACSTAPRRSTARMRSPASST